MALALLRRVEIERPPRAPLIHGEKGPLNEGPINGIPIGIIKVYQLLLSGGNHPGVSSPALYKRLVDNWCERNRRTIQDIEAAEATYKEKRVATADASP